MKKVILVALSVFILASCKKLEDLIKVNFVVPYSKTVAVTGLQDNPVIPPVVGLRASIPPIGVATNSTETMSNYNTSGDLVKSVVFSYLNVDVNEPSSQTLDMVDSLWLYVSASGLPEVLVSHYYDIPRGIRSLELETTDDNMKEYFLRDSMYFRIEGHFYNAPDTASVFTFTSKFDVVANPLKK
ncbi:MAG: hypothetical protein H6550_12680 [Chitinophagales bacterium]|nr:hypothetical protein [Chitinophagales bacterium]